MNLMILTNTCLLAGIFFLNSVPGNADKVKELSMDEAVKLSMKNSTALMNLKTKIEVSDRVIFERWRKFLPDVTLRYQKEDSVAFREDDYRSQSAMIEMGYDINTSARTVIEYKIAKIESILAGEEYRIERNNILLNVRKSFYELIRNLDEIEINKKLLEGLNLQKKIIDEEQRLGMATMLQQVQVDAKIKEAEYSILKSENEYKNRLKDFKVLIGFEPEVALSLKRPVKEIKDLPELGIGKGRLISTAFKNRSEFKKSRYTLYKTRKEKQLAKYYYLPKFRFTGSYGYTGEDYPPNKKTWNVGISVTTSIFGSSVNGSQAFGESDNGNTRKSSRSGSLGIFDDPSYLRGIIQSESGYREAELSYELLKKSIKVEVARVHDSLIENIELVKIAIKNEKMLEEQVRIENEKVRLGEITRYDLLQTYIELSKARLRKLSAQTEYLISFAALERAIGYDIGNLIRKK